MLRPVLEGWKRAEEEERHTPDGDQNRHDVGEVKLNDHVKLGLLHCDLKWLLALWNIHEQVIRLISKLQADFYWTQLIWDGKDWTINKDKPRVDWLDNALPVLSSHVLARAWCRNGPCPCLLMVFTMSSQACLIIWSQIWSEVEISSCSQIVAQHTAQWCPYQPHRPDLPLLVQAVHQGHILPILSWERRPSASRGCDTAILAVRMIWSLKHWK